MLLFSIKTATLVFIIESLKICLGILKWKSEALCYNYIYLKNSGPVCVFQLDYVGWQLNLQMAQSSQARLKSPSAVLQLGLRNEDSEVWTHIQYTYLL